MNNEVRNIVAQDTNRRSDDFIEGVIPYPLQRCVRRICICVTSCCLQCNSLLLRCENETRKDSMNQEEVLVTNFNDTPYIMSFDSMPKRIF